MHINDASVDEIDRSRPSDRSKMIPQNGLFQFVWFHLMILVSHEVRSNEMKISQSASFQAWKTSIDKSQ